MNPNIRATRLAVLFTCLAFTSGVAGLGAQKFGAEKPDQVIYTLSFPDAKTQTFRVEMTVPTDGKPSVELMMPMWSPGSYAVQNYAGQVSGFRAMTLDGTKLDVTQPAPNRWKMGTNGRPSVMIFYTVAAPRGSNLSNGVSPTSAVIIGPATFLMVADQVRRPMLVRMELPPTWKGSMTGLDGAVDTAANHYEAPDYDALVDGPILAGIDLTTTEFKVGNVSHYWVSLGKPEWDAAKITDELSPLIAEHMHFWGSLPYKRYAFLNIVGAAAGPAVEHRNSVALNSTGKAPADDAARLRNSMALSREYFQAMNVKRLRPAELGPFDYEHMPKTSSLWISEGLTSYYGELLAIRAALGSREDYLALISQHIGELQTKQPGRLVQSLEAASQHMGENLPADQKVDLDVKGPVVGLVLEAHIRANSKGKKSLDDVMRAEYKKWSGIKGYSPDDFWKTASEAAGFDVSVMLHKLVASTEEIDYTEMLDWFGLKFAAADAADPMKAWRLEVRADATVEQQQHLSTLLAHSKG